MEKKGFDINKKGKNGIQEFWRQYRPRILPIVNVSTFIVTAVINILGAQGVLANVATGDVSDKFSTAITPKGWAFSIWGVIYTIIALNLLVQFIQCFIFNRDNIFYNEKLSLILPANFLLNATWMIFWQYSYIVGLPLLWVSVVIIFGIFSTLVVMYFRVGVHYLQLPKTESEENDSTTSQEDNQNDKRKNLWEFYLIQAMISIYLGWITAASLVNFTAALTASTNGQIFQNASNSIWGAIVIGVTLLLAVVALSVRRDVVFSGVISWANFAIYDKQQSDPIIATASLLTATTVLILLVLTIGVNLYQYFKAFNWSPKKFGKHVAKSFKTSFTEPFKKKQDQEISEETRVEANHDQENGNETYQSVAS